MNRERAFPAKIPDDSSETSSSSMLDSRLTGVCFTALTTNSSYASSHATNPFVTPLVEFVLACQSDLILCLKLPHEVRSAKKLQLETLWRWLENGVTDPEDIDALMKADEVDDEASVSKVFGSSSAVVTKQLSDLRELSTLWLMPVDVVRHHHSWLLLHHDVDLTLADSIRELRCVTQHSPSGACLAQAARDFSSWIAASWRMRDRLWRTLRNSVDVHEHSQGSAATSPTRHQNRTGDKHVADNSASSQQKQQHFVSMSPFFPSSMCVMKNRRLGLRNVLRHAFRNAELRVHQRHVVHATPLPMFNETFLEELAAEPYLSPQRVASSWHAQQQQGKDIAFTARRTQVPSHPADDVWNAGAICVEYALCGWNPTTTGAGSDSPVKHNRSHPSAASGGKSAAESPNINASVYRLLADALNSTTAVYAFLAQLGALLRRGSSRAASSSASSSAHSHLTSGTSTSQVSRLAESAASHLWNWYGTGSASRSGNHAQQDSTTISRDDTLRAVGQMLLWERSERWSAFCNDAGIEEGAADDSLRPCDGDARMYPLLPKTVYRGPVSPDLLLQFSAFAARRGSSTSVTTTATSSNSSDHSGGELAPKTTPTFSPKRGASVAQSSLLNQIDIEYTSWKAQAERAALVDNGSLGATQAKHASIFAQLCRVLHQFERMSESSVHHFSGGAKTRVGNSSTTGPWVLAKRTSSAPHAAAVACSALCDPLFYNLLSQAQQNAFRFSSAATTLRCGFSSRQERPGSSQHAILPVLQAVSEFEVAALRAAQTFLPSAVFVQLLHAALKLVKGADDSTSGGSRSVGAQRSTTLDNVLGDTTRKASRGSILSSPSSTRSPGLLPSASPSPPSGGPPLSPAGSPSSPDGLLAIIAPHELSVPALNNVTRDVRNKLLSFWLGEIPIENIVGYFRHEMPHIPPTLRGEVWNVLLLSVGASASPPELLECGPLRRKKYLSHFIDETRYQPNCNDRQIAVDIPRCHQYNADLSSVDGHAKLARILKAWLRRNQNITYWQGADSVAAALLAASFDDELLVLSSLHQLTQHYIPHFFVVAGVGTMDQRLVTFTHLLRYHDPLLATHLEAIDCRPDLFGISWFLTLFAHVLPLRKVFIVWDQLFLSGNPNWICCLAAIAVSQLGEALLHRDFSFCVTALTNLSGFDVHAAVEEANELLRSTPPSLVSPAMSPATFSLMQTSSVALLDPSDLRDAFLAATAMYSGTPLDSEKRAALQRHWYDSGVFLLDVRSDAETSAPAQIGPPSGAALEDQLIVPAARVVSSSAGSTPRNDADDERGTYPPSIALQRIPSSSASSSFALNANSKNLRRNDLRVMGAIRCPYDSVDGWNVDVVIQLLCRLHLCAIAPQTADRHSPSSSLNGSHRAPHVVVVADSEPECGQSAAADLVRHGILNVSMVIGGLGHLRQVAPELVISSS